MSEQGREKFGRPRTSYLLSSLCLFSVFMVLEQTKRTRRTRLGATKVRTPKRGSRREMGKGGNGEREESEGDNLIKGRQGPPDEQLFRRIAILRDWGSENNTTQYQPITYII